MRKDLLVFVILSALFLGGCATLPEKIAPSEISDVPYQQWSCEQLSQEQPKLAALLAAASDKQRGCRKKDIAGILLVGLPVASLTGCSRASEISKLKGELQALQKAAVRENCLFTPLPEETALQTGIAITKVSRIAEDSQ